MSVSEASAKRIGHAMLIFSRRSPPASRSGGLCGRDGRHVAPFRADKAPTASAVKQERPTRNGGLDRGREPRPPNVSMTCPPLPLAGARGAAGGGSGSVPPARSLAGLRPPVAWWTLPLAWLHPPVARWTVPLAWLHPPMARWTHLLARMHFSVAWMGLPLAWSPPRRPCRRRLLALSTPPLAR